MNDFSNQVQQKFPFCLTFLKTFLTSILYLPAFKLKRTEPLSPELLLPTHKAQLCILSSASATVPHLPQFNEQRGHLGPSTSPAGAALCLLCWAVPTSTHTPQRAAPYTHSLTPHTVILTKHTQSPYNTRAHTVQSHVHSHTRTNHTHHTQPSHTQNHIHGYNNHTPYTQPAAPHTSPQAHTAPALPAPNTVPRPIAHAQAPLSLATDSFLESLQAWTANEGEKD